MKYIVWLKLKPDSPWEPNGDGAMSQKTAARVADEVGRYHNIPTRVLQVGQEPIQRMVRRSSTHE